MKKWLSLVLTAALLLSVVSGASAWTFGAWEPEQKPAAEESQTPAEAPAEEPAAEEPAAEEAAAEEPAAEAPAAEEPAAEAPAEALAYIMYADAAWAVQYWASETEGVTAKNAVVTGEGDYTVGLEFANEAQGLAFTALGIKNGEILFPGYYLMINAIRVNGEAIEFTKGCTSSDDGVETRMNIYNEWVSGVPADGRSYDGDLEGVSAIIVDKEAFASVKSVEIDFSLLKNGLDAAYIMYADTAWANQYWGTPAEGVTATEAEITGFGDYTVGLEFANEAQGLAFAALGIKKGEKTYGGAYLRINAIRVNGEDVAFTKGYTSSDNGVETRMNIYNEWVSEIPADARSFDGSLEGASWIIVDKEAFASVKTVEVDFSLLPVTDVAYIMFADSTWTNQYWMDGNEYPVTVQTAEVTGPGTYTVSLAFDTPASGVAFTAVGVKKGETTFPGYFIDVKSVKINGEEIAVGKGYTSSDDKIETRENLFNEWVAEIPADARRADGDLEGASAVIVDKAAFAEVSTMEVTFDYIFGVAPKAEDGPMSEDDANALKAEGFKAYIGVQGKDTYVFRNAWNDSYGLNDEVNPFFYRLTGWDESNNAVDYGGTFVDADITADGEYTVSLTTGEMGFGSTEAFNLLFVSTNIPSKLVADGFLTISGVKTKIGDARTQEYTDVDVSGDYVRLVVLDSYNRTSEPFGYTVPGPDTTISITFTVSGMGQ